MIAYALNSKYLLKYEEVGEPLLALARRRREELRMADRVVVGGRLLPLVLAAAGRGGQPVVEGASSGRRFPAGGRRLGVRFGPAGGCGRGGRGTYVKIKSLGGVNM